MEFLEVSQKSDEELFSLLGSSASGINEKEVQRRLKEKGFNVIPEKKIGGLAIFLRQFRSAFIYLLFFASLIAFSLREYINGLLILLFLSINTILGFVQEYKTERSLSLLKKFAQRKTRVARNGTEKMIKVEEIVAGDILFLKAGDRIPADCYFLKAESVFLDESALTGESTPVEKIAGPLKKSITNFYEASNIGFSQTTFIGGEAKLIVFATGQETLVGKIASKIEKPKDESAFEIGVSQFSSFILKLILITISFVFFVNLILRGNQINIGQLLIFSIALTVGVIPEPLPLVTTLSMTKGALNLAKKGVVPRRLSAIEDFGSIEILCTDKTGTITENRLEVAEIFGNKEETIFWALVASVELTVGRENINIFDRAIKQLISDSVYKKIRDLKKIDDFPFDPIRRCESVLIADKSGERFIVSRGAPEVFLDREEPKRKEQIEDWVKKQGEMGRRVLTVAKKSVRNSQKDINAEEEKRTEIMGIISFIDPLKPGAKKALQDAERLGVQVKILSGDSKEVVGWVAYQIGLIKSPVEVLTGDEFNRLSEAEKTKAVEKYSAFARTLPLQKYQILEVLQRKHFVGFLGEGFNDIPALKLAHLAVAVEKAADVAKESSDIILLKKSLKVIVDGIYEGRKIFANTIKYIRTTLISNLGNFFALVIASFVIDYLPMLPTQILLLNLLSDFPMIGIATDSVDESDLKRPKSYQTKEIAVIAVVLGLISTVFDFTFFTVFVGKGKSVLQTMWFIGSVLTELVLIFSIRTSKPFFKAKTPAFSILIISTIITASAIFLPFTSFGHKFFLFQKPLPSSLLLVFLLVGLYFLVSETVKLWLFRYLTPNRNYTKDFSSQSLYR